MKLRRSLLYMPGSDWKKIEKAATALDPDSICMDLEDGVALNKKFEARETIQNALQTLDFGRSEKLVRVNAFGSEFIQGDLEAVLPFKPDGIIIPKVSSGSELAWVDQIITEVEQQNHWQPGSILLLALVESALGVVNLSLICQAADRLVGLIFGAEDFASDVGAVRSTQGFEVLYARSAVVTHTAAFGLQAIDIVYTDFKNQEGFQQQALEGMHLGFSGKQLIHPNQIQPLHAVYTPDSHAIEYAQRVIAAAQAHQDAGAGAFALDGKMVDSPIIKAAEQVIARAQAAGLI